MDKINYQLKLDNIIKSLDGKTPKLLLHACCAPCSSYVLEFLSNYFEITILYYNPNIYPKEEYDRRLNELENFIPKVKYKNKVTLVKDEYIQNEYYESVKGLELLGEKSNRCYECYKLRMERAAKYAKDNSYDYFTTTLSISPYKVSSWINEIGQGLQNKYNINYLYSDFKKNNGYKRSQELSKEYGLYRQNYCGCIFSKKEREKYEEEKLNKLFNDVCKYYELGNLIDKPKRNDIGITNKIYKISTEKGEYILKILSSNNIQKLQMSEEISEIAQKNGVKSLCCIKKYDNYISNINGFNVILYPYYNGTIIKSNEISLNHIKLLAHQLAKLHSIKVDLNIDIKKYDKEDFMFLYNKTLECNDEYFDFFKENINKIVCIYDKVYDSYMKLSNQKSYVHKDFNRKNVLWNNDEFRIIDWETASIDNPSIDLFNSVWFLTDDIKKDKFNVFIKEYFSMMQIEDDYETAVFAALIEECNWLAFSLKRALKIITNNEYEIMLGANSIESSCTEILNYYDKTDLMLSLLKSTIIES